jgi:hypothetical protein
MGTRATSRMRDRPARDSNSHFGHLVATLSWLVGLAPLEPATGRPCPPALVPGVVPVGRLSRGLSPAVHRGTVLRGWPSGMARPPRLPRLLCIGRLEHGLPGAGLGDAGQQTAEGRAAAQPPLQPTPRPPHRATVHRVFVVIFAFGHCRRIHRRHRTKPRRFQPSLNSGDDLRPIRRLGSGSGRRSIGSLSAFRIPSRPTLRQRLPLGQPRPGDRRPPRRQHRPLHPRSLKLLRPPAWSRPRSRRGRPPGGPAAVPPPAP